jgi:hypothetical protein
VDPTGTNEHILQVIQLEIFFSVDLVGKIAPDWISDARLYTTSLFQRDLLHDED